jgi:hypothetical protein
MGSALLTWYDTGGTVKSMVKDNESAVPMQRVRQIST